ncbi:F-box family protein [Trifolium pratense]|uniref:F-box family protein n=1 Tax=Trifolium pratense TaxID=57577 RepID=A0A2K3KJ21_TRIPR|nr:F-box family protein [Trifolium pratense]
MFSELYAKEVNKKALVSERLEREGAVSAFRWKWKEPLGDVEQQQVMTLDTNAAAAFSRLWKSDVPSKINVFGWRLLLNRLPTRTALHRRGVLSNPFELSCVLCFRHREEEAHLFFSCYFSKVVWCKVLNWLGLLTSLDAEGRNSRHFGAIGFY